MQKQNLKTSISKKGVTMAKMTKTKIITFVVLAVLGVSVASAYYIGGAYVTLIDCSWGQYGNQYGNIGTYRDSNGKIYQVFFGNNYCQY